MTGRKNVSELTDDELDMLCSRLARAENNWRHWAAANGRAYGLLNALCERGEPVPAAALAPVLDALEEARQR